MIEFLPQNEGNLVALRFIGKLEHEDFDALTPILDAQIEKDGGKIRLLLDLSEFDGWEDLHALWNHFVLVKNHHKHVERIAVLGDEAWERKLAELADRFALAEVGYYTADRSAAAIEWLAG
ncbi:MAG: STAS/SEC14 domain-containing protein [Planctomycetes bacterium]|nr:STAS/SEC14 domain-containing protein [Planctomycetota bacterium]